MAIEKINSDHLHHAYLLEGEREIFFPEITRLMQELKIATSGNPDYTEITLDVFRVDDARNLKSLSLNKSAEGERKVFVVVTNQFLPEAQNVMLKVFEEPVPGTHFFLIVPSADILLPTLTSRLYKISHRGAGELQEAEKFVNMNSHERIEFLKVLLKENDEDEDTPSLSSARTRALSFLNSLETTLHKVVNLSSEKEIDFFHQIFAVREYLRQPGSSAKSLMESLALTIPQFKL